MATRVRFAKLEKNNPNVQKKIAVTTSIKVEIAVSAMPTPPRKNARLCTGIAVKMSKSRYTTAEPSFPNTRERAESREVRNRSKVWRSRSEEIAPDVSAGPIKLTINNSSKTTVLKITLPTVCK